MTPKKNWRHVAVEGGWDGVADESGNLICKLVANEPANADLIAAAPDMRTLLEKIGTGEWSYIEGSQMYTDIYEVLAKAMGEA